MPQPDSGDNCCDCPSRTSPCDDCGGATTGACCIDGVCSIRSHDDCAGLGGIYQGNGIPCDPTPCIGLCCQPITVCPDPVDTVCVEGGECLSTITRVECAGTWGVASCDDCFVATPECCDSSNPICCIGDFGLTCCFEDEHCCPLDGGCFPIGFPCPTLSPPP